MTAEYLKFILVLDNVDYTINCKTDGTTNHEPTSKRKKCIPLVTQHKTPVFTKPQETHTANVFSTDDI